MLRVKDRKGRTTFVLRDEDEQPISIDQLVLNDLQSSKEKKAKDEKETTEETVETEEENLSV